MLEEDGPNLIIDTGLPLYVDKDIVLAKVPPMDLTSSLYAMFKWLFTDNVNPIMSKAVRTALNNPKTRYLVIEAYLRRKHEESK